MGALRTAWSWLTESPAPTPGTGLEARRAFGWPYSTDLTQAGYFLSSASPTYSDREAPPYGFTELVDQAFKANAIIFACELKRISVFSEARFLWRRFNKGRPGSLWSDASLQILQQPWPRATTSDL